MSVMVRPFIKLSLLLLSALPLVAWHAAAAQAKSPAESMTAAAQAFLASLTSDQRSEATVPFNSPERRDWHNIPKDDRKGVEFGKLSDEQQQLALALLHAALSDEGYDKALKIMSLENNLREGEKNLTGAPLRDPERYFITIFGEPAATGVWGWSFEGHHFSQNSRRQRRQSRRRHPQLLGRQPGDGQHLHRRAAPRSARAPSPRKNNSRSTSSPASNRPKPPPP
jgi:hypothetical protein